MKQVIVIDPLTATVREEEWDGSLEQLYKWMRCTFVHRTKEGLWVDEDARMKPHQARWYHPAIYPQQILGVGVLEKSKKSMSVKSLQKEVQWGLLFDPHAPTRGSA